MLGLEPDLQNLVEAARACDDPSAADRERVTRALAARLGIGALVATSAAATLVTASATAAKAGVAATAVPVAGAGLGTGAKVLALVALAGTVGIGATVALHARAPVVPRAAERKIVTEHVPAPQPSSIAETSTLEEEVRLLKDAQQSLRDHRPASALALLDEHARRFSTGLLRPERMAARVLALCALGRVDEAHRDGERFLREWPTSPLCAQVRASCAQR